MRDEESLKDVTNQHPQLEDPLYALREKEEELEKKKKDAWMWYDIAFVEWCATA